MSKPTLSIVIATYNSKKLIKRVFGYLAKQTYPENKYEVIVVDGGSKDGTVQFVKKQKYTLVDNPRTEPVYGKYLGFIRSRGKYVMFLDHDEVMTNKNSIKRKVELLEKHNNVKAIAGGNYKNPDGYPFINEYINEFGDPFSYFVYRLSKRNHFFIQSMKKRYTTIEESDSYVIFDLSKAKSLPIIELVAGASMYDSEYLKNKYPATLDDYRIMTHHYYLLYKEFPFVAVMKNDAILHYSADNFTSYIKKINWRIKNNIYHKKGMGKTGYTGREDLTKINRTFKYLFVPYSLSIVLPMIDAVYLSVSRKDIRYLLHVPLASYTALMIVYHSIRAMVGYYDVLKNYDGTKEVEGG